MKLALLLILFLVGACLPTTKPEQFPTNTISPTSSPTSTVIWFPPSSTPTQIPAIIATSTPDLLSGIGDILLADDFSDSGLWSLLDTSVGSIAYGINELTIAITTPNGYLFSIREQTEFTDFHIEIMANPTLCTGTDEYGLLLRVSPTLDYYRYSISCDQQVRLDRIMNGKASSPQPWMPTATLPPGAPISSLLSVRAFGKEMRFFINDTHQFTISDPYLSTGSIGIFARSTGETAVTVSFTNLLVRSVSD